MNIKFELYTDIFIEFSFEELKDEVEQILNISDIITYHLQHETIGLRTVEAHKNLRLQKSSTDGYNIILMGCAWSAFRDSETSFRIVVGLDEDDIQLSLKQNISIFVTYELLLEIYANKDIAEAVYTMGDHEETLQIEYDDITKKTKLILYLFGDTFGKLQFDERSCSIFSWVLRPFTIINLLMQFILMVLLFTLVSNFIPKYNRKIHLKCDVIAGSVVNGLRQGIFFSFVLDKPSGYKVFCEPETIHFKKINKSVLNTINFYLENGKNEEVDFNQETLTFTLQMIKIWTINWAFKDLKLIVIGLVKSTTRVQKTWMVR